MLSFVLLFFTIDLLAQENIKPDKPNHTFNFYFINGYAISYNFYETKSFFLRGQLDLSISKQDIDMEGERIYNYETSENKNITSGNNEDDYFSVGASAHVVFPLYSTNYGSIYFGAGPIFTYATRNYSYSESNTEYYPDTNAVQYSSASINTNEEKNYDAGVLAYIGLQGIISKNISIFVEAHIKGGKRWKESDWEYINTNSHGYYNKTTSTSSGDGWFYEAQFIKLGVSISI